MTDFSTLKADLADWAAKTTLTAKIPSFIRIAEAMINRDVRVLEMESDVTLTITSANNYEEDLPTGFLGFKSLYNSSGSTPDMVYIPPDKFKRLKNSPSSTFQELRDGSTAYTIESNKLKIFVSTGATADVTIEAVYFQRLTALSDANPTNDLLTNHYDLYLYAALTSLWDYDDELEMEAKYTKKYDRVVASIGNTEIMRRRAPDPRQRRVPAQRVT